MSGPAPAPLAALRAGAKPAMARALARIEAAAEDPATLELLDAACAQPRAHVVGVTGPPGVGKSTLVSTLIQAWRQGGRSVGVLAVDPSSRRSGGALLGDRVRLDLDPEDQHVFVRSLAARERLGGLAPLTHAAVVLMRAVYDRVLVETVGVGQSETDVAAVCDTVVLCVQPASGDSLQYMKAGIAEVPDVAVVNKADMGAFARRAQADVEAALALSPHGGGWRIPVLLVSASTGQGIGELLAALDQHFSHLRSTGELSSRREAQLRNWLEEGVQAEFGRFGLARAVELALLPGDETLRAPFACLVRAAQSLRRAWSG